VICGLDEAIAILKTCSGVYRDEKRAENLYRELRRVQWRFQDASARQRPKEIAKWQKERIKVRSALNRLWESGWHKLKVWALRDGNRVKRHEPVLGIIGDPRFFVHLETVLLGVIARPTATATSVADVVKVANGKQILFFPARFDHYWIQATDGYAALKAGAFAVSTDANADYWGVESMGTMPHFLIGCYGGDTSEAAMAFDRHTSAKVNRIALVDWENDCIGTTRKIIDRMIAGKLGTERVGSDKFRKHASKMIGKGKGKLWGVRFDTSAELRDKSVRGRSSFGVCPELIRKARKAFDSWGCHHLKIVASGGFSKEKIQQFERLKLPVDAYGVGSSLLRYRCDMTADIVGQRGEPCAKIGRRKKDWSRLTRVK